MTTGTYKNKIAIAKNVVSKISIPTNTKAENAKQILNLQIGKVILQIKKE